MHSDCKINVIPLGKLKTVSGADLNVRFIHSIESGVQTQPSRGKLLRMTVHATGLLYHTFYVVHKLCSDCPCG